MSRRPLILLATALACVVGACGTDEHVPLGQILGELDHAGVLGQPSPTPTHGVATPEPTPFPTPEPTPTPDVAGYLVRTGASIDWLGVDPTAWKIDPAYGTAQVEAAAGNVFYGWEVPQASYTVSELAADRQELAYWVDVYPQLGGGVAGAIGLLGVNLRAVDARDGASRPPQVTVVGDPSGLGNGDQASALVGASAGRRPGEEAELRVSLDAHAGGPEVVYRYVYR